MEDNNDVCTKEESDEDSNYSACKRLIWSKWDDCGFPDRVNHATTGYTDEHGRRYVYTMGGFAGRGRSFGRGNEQWNDLGEIDLDVCQLDVGKFNLTRIIIYALQCKEYDVIVYNMSSRNDIVGHNPSSVLAYDGTI